MIKKVNKKLKSYLKSFGVLNKIRGIVKNINLYFLSKAPNKSKIPLTYEEAVAKLSDLRPRNPSPPDLVFSKAEIDVSVIIPAWNSEKTIKRCIESLLNQKTSSNFEVIVVNDGSTDNTKSLIESFDDKRVRAFTIQNSGPGPARNFGLSQSKGKYVMFVDSDDVVLPNAVSLTLKEALATNACIVEGNYFLEYEGYKSLGKKEKKRFEIVLPKDLNIILTLSGFPWGRLYKRELFYDTPFPSLTFEDTLIWMITLRRAKTIIILPESIYIYKVNSSSETSSVHKGTNKGIDNLYVLQFLFELNKKIQTGFEDIFYQQVLRQLGQMMYIRNHKLGKEVMESLLVVSKKILEECESFSPDNLSFKQKCLKKAILTSNMPLYLKSI